MESPFEAWLERYKRAWEDKDPSAARDLFTQDATYQETPFDEPMRGHAEIHSYWSEIPDKHDDVHFGYEILSDTEHQGIARWWCDFRRIPSGAKVKLDGIFLVHFSAERATAFREWWHRKETPS